MKKVLKTILIVIVVILFPIGILYCIGKALFADNRTFATYLGMLFIFLAGFIVCFLIFRQDLVQAAVNWINNIIGAVS